MMTLTIAYDLTGVMIIIIIIVIIIVVVVEVAVVIVVIVTIATSALLRYHFDFKHDERFVVSHAEKEG